MPLTPLPDLYPLTFDSILKEKVWGGNNLQRIFNKKIHSEKCGEIWELASINEESSVVSNGPLSGKDLQNLIHQYKDQLVGKKVYSTFGDQFPLLVKFIDANMDLSIQVHPNNEQAKPLNSLGKSEMWYILEAGPKAKLITGFSQKTDKEQFVKRVQDKSIEEVLHQESVKKGDIYYTPAGRIHNIGAGLVIAEIQQASNITYRIHDFDRADLTGEKRELHLQEALEVLDFEVIEDGKVNSDNGLNQLTTIVDSPHFTVNKINFDTPIIRNLDIIDSFKIYLCLEGEIDLSVEQHEIHLNAGDVYLIPAIFDTVHLKPTDTSLLLEAYIA